MGYYIEGPTKGKADYIVQLNESEAEIVSYDEAAVLINDSNIAIIVVMDNGAFEAAGFAFDKDEFKAFTVPSDTRPKKFIKMDRTMAKTLSGYN